MRNAPEHGRGFRPVITKTHKGLKIEIRPIRLEDAASTLAVERALIEAQAGEVRTIEDFNDDVLAFEEALMVYTAPDSHQNGIRIVALCEGLVAGSAEAWRLPPGRLRHVAEFSIGVHPERQGHGIGRALVQRILHWCLEGPGSQGPPISRIQLQVRADNVGAIRLYEQLGFRTEATMERYVETGPDTFVDNLLMVHRPSDGPGKDAP